MVFCLQKEMLMRKTSFCRQLQSHLVGERPFPGSYIGSGICPILKEKKGEKRMHREGERRREIFEKDWKRDQLAEVGPTVIPPNTLDCYCRCGAADIRRHANATLTYLMVCPRTHKTLLLSLFFIICSKCSNRNFLVLVIVSIKEWYF